MDCDTSEVVEIKQVDTGVQFDAEQTEDTQRRDLKERSRNIDDQTNG